MNFFEWALGLRLHLDKLETLGIQSEDIEIGLSPDAFVRLLGSKEFLHLGGPGNSRQAFGVRFVVARAKGTRKPEAGKVDP